MALAAFDRGVPHADIARSLDEIHSQLLGTSGVAASICQVARKGESLQYLAVGSVHGRFVDASLDGGHDLSTLPGRLGTDADAQPLDARRHAWPPGACLVLSTAGPLTTLDTGQYPGLLRRDPTLVATQLYADHRTGPGDTTMVVIQNQPVAAASTADPNPGRWRNPA